MAKTGVTLDLPAVGATWVEQALAGIEACRVMEALVIGALGSASQRGFRFATTYSPVLELGWVFVPGALPDGVPAGLPQRCYHNSGILAGRRYRQLAYVEGYATRIMPAISHAWCAEVPSGRMVDNTWRELGIGYVGIPFEPRWARAHQRSRRLSNSLLNDYESDHLYLRTGFPEEATHPTFAERVPREFAWPIEAFLAEFSA